MNFNEYQKVAHSTAVYNEGVELRISDEMGGMYLEFPFMYPLLALGEEVGEVQGKIAKFIRKSKTESDTEKLSNDVALELGDVLWQLSEVATQFGFPLEEIAQMNLDKLAGRKERGTLIGQGDAR